MPATCKIVLAHKPNAEGLFDVRLRITANRDTTYAGLGISIAAKHWNANGNLENEMWVKSGNRQASQHNEDLVLAVLDAKRLSKSYPNASAADLKQLFLKRHEPAAPSSPEVVAFMEKSLLAIDLVKYERGTYELRRGVINKIIRWRNGRPLSFAELTVAVVDEFDAYLEALPNCASTRHRNLNVFHLYVKRAIRAKLLSRDDNPFEDYDYPSPAPRRTRLTDTELEQYEQAALPPKQHLARLTYLICFYLHGSRIGAVLRLRWRDRKDGFVSFTMDKGGLEKVIPEAPQLTAILDSLKPASGEDPDAYILPWLRADYDQLSAKAQLQAISNATQKVNNHTRAGAAAAGITRTITTHSSRRTVAKKADRANGGNLGLVGGMLGHKARATTEIYTEAYNSEETIEAANRVYADRPMPRLKAG